MTVPSPPPARGGWPWAADVDRSFDPIDAPGWTPRVSLVMPSLNQGIFVEAAIRSVLLQNYPDVELIVVDGGSTDGSDDVFRAYDSHLAHWVSECDRGPAHALNKGFARATGDILGFLNADDFLLPGSLAKVVREFARHPWADVVSGHGYFANARGEIGSPFVSDRFDLKRLASDACVLVQAATFFRSSRFLRIDGFNEANRTAWDMELWADLARAGARFHRFDEYLSVFRLHEQSITCRLELRKQRRRDARAVRQKVKGRVETTGDRVNCLLQRIWKFSGHPLRTLNQRLFFHATLNRWSV